MLLLAALLLFLVLPSPWNVIVGTACLAAFAGEVYFWNRTVRGRREAIGAKTLIGTTGTVLTPCHPVGQVGVGGERWEARCVDGADTGDAVRVVGIEGLTLVVEKVS